MSPDECCLRRGKFFSAVAVVVVVCSSFDGVTRLDRMTVACSQTTPMFSHLVMWQLQQRSLLLECHKERCAAAEKRQQRQRALRGPTMWLTDELLAPVLTVFHWLLCLVTLAARSNRFRLRRRRQQIRQSMSLVK